MFGGSSSWLFEVKASQGWRYRSRAGDVPGRGFRGRRVVSKLGSEELRGSSGEGWEFRRGGRVKHSAQPDIRARAFLRIHAGGWGGVGGFGTLEQLHTQSHPLSGPGGGGVLMAIVGLVK